MLISYNFKNDKNLLKTEFTERLGNAFLLILKPPTSGSRTPIYRSKLSETFEPITLFNEVKLKGISADQVFAILAPEPLCEKLKRYFPNIEIKEVGFKNEKLRFPIHETLKYWNGKNVTVTISVPAFDEGLLQFIKEHNPKNICTHVIRLHTLMDVEYNLQQKNAFYLQAEHEIQIQHKAATVIQKNVRGSQVRAQSKPLLAAYSQLHKQTVETLKEYKLDACDEHLQKLKILKARASQI